MSGATLDIRQAARHIRDSDLRKAVLGLADEGWRAIRFTGKCHLLMEHPGTGARITASSSPSDRHAAQMLRRHARRAATEQRPARS